MKLNKTREICFATINNTDRQSERIASIGAAGEDLIKWYLLQIRKSFSI